ncbi:MAG: signal peptidase I [Anaerolineae bacterium]|jgi:signal peptidase I|nr:signal peptidase I [Anaerolineae bacterium]
MIEKPQQVAEAQGSADTGQIDQAIPRTKGFIREALETILLAVVLYFLIDGFVARVEVKNISMQPTLYEGELLLVNRMAYRLGEYSHGDIIVFHFPQDPAEDYIKRLIGLPGDTVVVSNGVVTVNGQDLVESYISAPPAYTGEWVVPEDMLFVLGDNRNSSYDSHSWGFVPFENVVGRAIFIYWPLNELRAITRDKPDGVALIPDTIGLGP